MSSIDVAKSASDPSERRAVQQCLWFGTGASLGGGFLAGMSLGNPLLGLGLGLGLIGTAVLIVAGIACLANTGYFKQ